MTDNMTQTNNEREAFELAFGNYYLGRNPLNGNYVNHETNLAWIGWNARALSKLSHNEQQEAVALYGARRLTPVGTKEFFGTLLVTDLEEGVKLYTSPPKQAIPEGWKLVPIESDEKMKDGARAFLAGLELGTKTFENMSEHLRLSGAYLPDWFLNSRGHINKMAKAHYIYDSMISVAPTNTEVVE